jgi:xylan 1,4-beta-xylosidase
MGIAKEAQDVQRGFQIVRSFPTLKDLPIVLSEADPEGCAACSSRVYPQNAYRNGTLYPAYTGLMLKNIFDLADRERVNIAGMLTWAFEFEDQPYFDGFRTLATNGIDKPVLNVFRMAGRMSGQRVSVESSGRIPVDTIAAAGVRAASDIDALATRSSNDVSILVWNYQDEDVPADASIVKLAVTGLPGKTPQFSLRHYRIDQNHSNAYEAWKQMGSPQKPDAAQYKKLEAAGALDLLEPPRQVSARGGSAQIEFTLPLQAISLIQLSWR